MLGVVPYLVFDFILYLVTVYIRNFPLHVTYEHDTAQNTLCITRSKYVSK